MDHKLHKEYACESIGELRVALEEIRQSIPASMLHKYFDDIDCRMKRHKCMYAYKPCLCLHLSVCQKIFASCCSLP